MNVFEGARRVALVIAAAWVVGCVVVAATSSTYLSLAYDINGYGSLPVLANEKCGEKDAVDYLNAFTPDGEIVNVALCFKATRADNGEMLIPYRKAVSSTNPVAAPMYKARANALARGDHVEAGRLADQITALPLPAGERGVYWMAGPYDPGVQHYIKEVRSQFELTALGIAEYDKEKAAQRLEAWKFAAVTMCVGLFIGWIMMVTIGWIVRGFMGIPRGKDARSRGDL